MPQMGVSVAEGTIVEWRKRVGDWVESDETICEISTDKVDTRDPLAGERPRGPHPGRGERDGRRRDSCWRSSTPRRGRARRTQDENADRQQAAERVARQVGDLAGRSADRRGARHRPREGGRHGRRRSRAEEGRACLHRSRRATGRRSAPLHTRIPLPARGSRATGGGRESRCRAMRRQIAEHMLRSRRTAAHVHDRRGGGHEPRRRSGGRS